MRTILPVTPDSVSAARRYARDVLSSRGVTITVVETVELLTSEVMTYALRTARRVPQELQITLTEDHIGVEVSDCRPAGRRRPATGPRGRSRMVIETLAQRWGIVVEPRSRHLWFTVSR